MAEEGVVLDIDSKFLQNLKQADAALKASVKHAQNMTKAFTKMVTGSGGFTSQTQQILSGLQKLGGMNRIDFSSGIAKIDASARNATDAVNLLSMNMSKLKMEYSKLSPGARNRGTHLRITSDADLENIAKLRTAVSQINATLNNKSRKKPLSLVDINNLTAQRDLYRRAIAELNSTDSRRTKRVIAEVNARIKETRREESAVRKAADAYNTSTPKRAISFANQAKSLDELRRAYKYLEQARNKINPNTESGRRNIDELNKKLSETKNRISEITGKTAGWKSMLGNLKPLLSTVFGVQAIRSFMNQLITTRGEFEMQHKSLQVLLRSRAQANELWEQTTELALKSPFQVKQLVTATKQLAAYRVESSKLHSTTKMLADISAGLGVEISRLILAFGQVKAAGFLRGTELRQFTEAGVNMLDELARYYTNIEGKTVTVSQVFERITKRMVSFRDVENVLKNITSEGGIFYNMQEEQATTLRGQISNLKDSIQLMFNDIGDSSDGALKSWVSFFRTIVENWRTVKNILVVGGSLWAIYTIGVKTNTAALFANAAAARGSAMSFAALRTALFGVSDAFAKGAIAVKGLFASIGPIGWFLLALEGVIALYNAMSVDLDEINDTFNKLSKTAGTISTKFSFAIDKDDFEAQKASLREMIDFAERELQLRITPTIDLDSDTLNTDKLVEEMAEVQRKVNNQLSMNRQLAIGVEEREAWRGGNVISKDVEQYQETVEAQYQSLISMRQRLMGELSNLNRQKQLDNETEDEYINRLNKETELLNTLKALEQEIGEDAPAHFRRLQESAKIIRVAYSKYISEGFDEVSESYYNTLYDMGPRTAELLENEFIDAFRHINIEHIPESERALALKASIDTTVADKQWDDWTKYLMYEFANIKFGVTIETDPPVDTPDEDLNTNTDPKNKTKDKRWQIAIEAIDKYNKGIKKLRKNNDDVTSASKAWEYYGSAVEDAAKKAGLSIDKYLGENASKLTTDEGVKVALNALRESSLYEEDKRKVDDLILNMSIETDADVQEDLFNSLSSVADELFAGYEVSIELDKLRIPKSFAQDFFGIDVLDLESAKAKLLGLEDEFMTHGERGVKAYQKYLDKIDEMEIKSQQERLKKYLSFARESVGERAKIMLDGFYELQDIEKTFQLTDTIALNKGLINEGTKMTLEATGQSVRGLLELSDVDLVSKWGFTEPQIKKLREFNNLLQEQASLAENESRRQIGEKLNKMDWEAFRGSDTFQTLFNDLEGASEQALGALIKHLEKYKDQWSSLPLGQMKAMVKLLEQAKEAQAGLVGPMEGLRNARAKMAESGYSDRGIAEADLFSSEQRIAELDHELAVLAEVQRLKDEGYTDLEIFDTLSFEDASIAMSQTKDNAETLKGEQEKISSSAKQYLDNLKKIPKYYNEIRERASKVKQMTDKVFDGWDAVNELFEEGSMSQELAELVSASADIGFEAFNSVQMFKEAKDAIAADGTQAEIFGYQLNAALGIIGLIVSAIQIIAKVLKFAFEQHDKNLQKQIDAQLLKIKELQDAYEDLEKQIEKAYTAVDLGKLTKDATSNLNAQIKATEAAIALEEDKKKTDEDAIRDWKDDIRDMRKSIEELQEETFSTLTDGILDDVLDATRGFVDAWHDAYEETGDGMKGLEENFTDMLRNMLRQQASMQLISPFIKRYKEWLSEYVNEDDDPTLTASEASAWAERVRATFPELNELLKGFFEGTQGLLETGGELSDLEKGIQGMTEDQAEVLAAYWNSCRFTLANIDSTLTQMANATLGGVESNPILRELKAQTELISSINNLFKDVVGRGESNHSGAYLKVLMS